MNHWSMVQFQHPKYFFLLIGAKYISEGPAEILFMHTVQTLNRIDLLVEVKEFQFDRVRNSIRK